MSRRLARSISNSHVPSSGGQSNFLPTKESVRASPMLFCNSGQKEVCYGKGQDREPESWAFESGPAWEAQCPVR